LGSVVVVVEEFLTTRFGADYLDYKKHVPALIPRPW
jgi:protein-S-isoprenylcysteine O-methyltransferase Ste14